MTLSRFLEKKFNRLNPAKLTPNLMQDLIAVSFLGKLGIHLVIINKSKDLHIATEIILQAKDQQLNPFRASIIAIIDAIIPDNTLIRAMDLKDLFLVKSAVFWIVIPDSSITGARTIVSFSNASFW